MAHRFGRNPSDLCLIFKKVMDTIYETHHHCLESWGQPFLFADQLHNYALAGHQRGAPLQNGFRFVLGTVRRIAQAK